MAAAHPPTILDQFQQLLVSEAPEGKAVILLEALPTDVDEVEIDQLRSLPRVQAPKAVADAYEKIRAELAKIDTDNRNTESGREAHKVIQGHLKKINKSVGKKLDQAFNSTLALTLAAKNDAFWYHDTDMPEKVDEILADLGSVWGKLFNQTPDALGILPSGRTAIEGMLEKFRSDIVASGYDAPWPKEGRW